MSHIIAFLAGLVAAIVVAGVSGCASSINRSNLSPYIVRMEGSDKWIWQVVSANNQLIAQSEQEFDECEAALANYTLVRNALKATASPAIIVNHKL